MIFLRMFIIILALASCGSPQEEPVPSISTPTLVIGPSSTFATTELTVRSGSTLLISNMADTPHTITSQSAPDAYDQTGDFDVLVPSNSHAYLSVPTAASGTVFYFYCDFYLENMTPSFGTMTIE